MSKINVCFGNLVFDWELLVEEQVKPAESIQQN